MKSFIFCTSCVNNQSERHHISRYKRWINFYQPHMNTLCADRIFIIDDGGTGYQGQFPYFEGELPERLNSVFNFYRFNSNLGRNSLIEFPGWWRSFLFSINIARKYGYKKIIHIESDFFILSEELKQFIATTNLGWTSLHSEYYNRPETAIQIICDDEFENFDKLRTSIQDANYITDDYAESLIPFTNIEKRFVGDRFGEDHVFASWVDSKSKLIARLDYFGQVVFPPDQTAVF